MRRWGGEDGTSPTWLRPLSLFYHWHLVTNCSIAFCFTERKRKKSGNKEGGINEVRDKGRNQGIEEGRKIGRRKDGSEGGRKKYGHFRLFNPLLGSSIIIRLDSIPVVNPGGEKKEGRALEVEEIMREQGGGGGTGRV